MSLLCLLSIIIQCTRAIASTCVYVSVCISMCSSSVRLRGERPVEAPLPIHVLPRLSLRATNHAECIAPLVRDMHALRRLKARRYSHRSHKLEFRRRRRRHRRRPATRVISAAAAAAAAVGMVCHSAIPSLRRQSQRVALAEVLMASRMPPVVEPVSAARPFVTRLPSHGPRVFSEARRRTVPTPAAGPVVGAPAASGAGVPSTAPFGLFVSVTPA